MHKKGYRGMEYRNYRLAENFPLLHLSGEEWKISDIPSSRLHFHNCVEIGICHPYGGILQVYDRCIPFREGDITCIPPNIPHTTWSDPGEKSRWSYLFFEPEALFRDMLPGSILSSFFSESGRDSCFVFSGEEAGKLYPLAQEILRELEQKEMHYRICVRSLLSSLLVKISRAKVNYFQLQGTENLEKDFIEFPHQQMPSIIPALTYVEEKYPEQFPMANLAKVCCLSETHFRRLFQQIMHTSPLAYLQEVRIEKACGLLCRSEDPILTIAEKVGFCSVSNFNRQFMRFMKMTPSEYKRKQRMIEKSEAGGKVDVSEFSGWLLPEENPQ